MRLYPALASGMVLPPSVTLCIPWGGVCSIWYIWEFCTLTFPAVGEEPVLSFLTRGQYGLATAVNLALAT